MLWRFLFCALGKSEREALSRGSESLKNLLIPHQSADDASSDISSCCLQNVETDLLVKCSICAKIFAFVFALRLRLQLLTISRSATPTTDNQYSGEYKRVAKTEAKILAQNHFPTIRATSYDTRVALAKTIFDYCSNYCSLLS